MTKLKRVKELPSWFRPERYKELARFNAQAWLEQLRHRKWLFEGNPVFPKSTKGQGHHEDMDAWKKRVEVPVAQLLQDPLLVRAESAIFIVRGEPRPTMIQRGEFWDFGAGEAPLQEVRFKSILNLALRDSAFAEDGSADAERWECIKNLGGRFSVSAEIAESAISIGHDRHPVLSVNLSASDADLEAYFEQWLKRARLERGMPDTVRKNAPPYASWIDYGVLPYLDLKIWSLQRGIEITAQAFADMLPNITGNYDRGLDSVRDNTIVWAKKLMIDLSALEELAKAERDLF